MYTNVALYPAVPPGGSLIRTSVMATHEREHLDRALEAFEAVKRRFPDLPSPSDGPGGRDREGAAGSSRSQLEESPLGHGGAGAGPEMFERLEDPRTDQIKVLLNPRKS